MTTPSEEYRTIQLTKGFEVKVSLRLFFELSKFKWYVVKGTNGYYAARGHTILMHRQILGLESGDRRVGDHINQDTLDNRDENLRIVTPSQSVANRKSYSYIGYKGVRVDTKTPTSVVAYIRLNGKFWHLGSFPNTPIGIVEAARAYDKAAVEIYGDYAKTNFPGDM